MSVTVRDLRYALETSAASQDFTARSAQATAPSGDGVFDLLDPANKMSTGPNGPSYIYMQPIGTNGDADDFSMRVWGWKKVLNSDIWIPALLVELTAVLSTGCDFTAIAADTYAADTITVDYGPSSGSFLDVMSTANDTEAHMLLHLRGVRYIDFDFDNDNGAQEAASANCLWAPTD